MTKKSLENLAKYGEKVLINDLVRGLDDLRTALKERGSSSNDALEIEINTLALNLKEVQYFRALEVAEQKYGLDVSRFKVAYDLLVDDINKYLKKE